MCFVTSEIIKTQSVTTLSDDTDGKNPVNTVATRPSC